MRMKITKFQHACVLVEDNQHVALFDPGQYTMESGLLDPSQLTRLDYVLITHEHFDHFSIELCKKLAQAFPGALFVSTPVVITQLHDAGIHNTSEGSNEHIDIAPLKHDGMAPLGPTPPCDNVRFHYKDLVTHPGDTLRLEESKEILLLPLAGPWEAAIDAVALGLNLRPKAIVPIHDKMWDVEWQRSMYDRLENFYAEHGITFVKAIDGQSFTL